MSLTNLYLDRDEYDQLRRLLPGRLLHKTRWNAEYAGRHVAIGEFHDQLEGLVLAETELEPAEALLPKPDFAVRDVTSDDRYSGGRLAAATATEIEQLLEDSEICWTARPPNPSESELPHAPEVPVSVSPSSCPETSDLDRGDMWRAALRAIRQGVVTGFAS